MKYHYKAVETEILVEDIKTSDMGIDNESWSTGVIDFCAVSSLFETGIGTQLLLISGAPVVANIGVDEAIKYFVESREIK